MSTWMELVEALAAWTDLQDGPGPRDDPWHARQLDVWERVRKLAAKVKKDPAFARWTKALSDDALALGIAPLLQQVVDSDDDGAALALDAARTARRELWRTTPVVKLPCVGAWLSSPSTLLVRTQKQLQVFDVAEATLPALAAGGAKAAQVSAPVADVMAWHAPNSSELFVVMRDGSVMRHVGGKKKPELIKAAACGEHDMLEVAAVSARHVVRGVKGPDASFEREIFRALIDDDVTVLPDDVSFFAGGLCGERPWLSLQRSHPDAPRAFVWADGPLQPVWRPEADAIHAVERLGERVIVGRRDAGWKTTWHDLETSAALPALTGDNGPFQVVGDRVWTPTGATVRGDTRTQVLGQVIRSVLIKSDTELLCVAFDNDNHWLRSGTLLHRP